MFHWILQCSMCALLLAASCGDVHVGAALNIFHCFGDLGAVVKVNPHHDTNWFFNHDSVDVFEEVLETRSPPHLNDAVFNGDFNLELCDSLDQLKEAYFRGYTIEQSEKPWRAFTGGWNSAAVARHFGLNASYVTGQHGYVLARLTKSHQLVRLTPHLGLQVNNWTAERMGQVVPGEVSSVLDFFRVSGSHYVTSYTTGESLYQVFVFTPSVYTEMKKVMRQYEESSLGLDQVLTFLTPWHVEHMGRVRASSGNSSLEYWAAHNLRSHILMFTYSSLLKLHSHPELLQNLDYLLGNDALLSANLKTLAPLFSDEAKRLWFEEVLENHLKLWELNV